MSFQYVSILFPSMGPIQILHQMSNGDMQPFIDQQPTFFQWIWDHSQYYRPPTSDTQLALFWCSDICSRGIAQLENSHLGWVWLLSLLSLFLCSIGGPWCCLSLKRGRMCHCISRWNAGKDGRTQHSNPVEAKTRERNWCPESWEGRHCHPTVFFVQDEQSKSQHFHGVELEEVDPSSSSSSSSSAAAQLSSSSHFAVIGRSKRWSNHPRHGQKEGSRERGFHAPSQCADFWIWFGSIMYWIMICNYTLLYDVIWL